MGTSVVIVSPLAGVFEEAGMSKHLKTVLYKVVLISMLSGLLGFTIALAASGDLDTTFSGDGKVTIDFGGYDQGYAILSQPADGRYVLGGYTCDPPSCAFGLARVLP